MTRPLTKVRRMAHVSVANVDRLGTVRAGLNLDADSMKKVYDYFKLEPGTRDFIGHAMALYLDDS